MAAFWDVILEPLAQALAPGRILEIGAEFGQTTRLLVDYAEAHGSIVHVIDPRPRFDVDRMAGEHPNAFMFHRDLSLNVLPDLPAVDLALIDGDHNHYTVLNELRMLERQAESEGARAPVIALHDIDWPYGRRDVYYEPESIPAHARRPFEVRGLDPDVEGLVDGGLNSHLANATAPAERHSGVRGAVEDFVEESDAEWTLFEVSGQHGLGILARADLLKADEGVRELLESTEEPGFLRGRVEAVERSRIDAEQKAERLSAELATESAVRAEIEQVRAEAEQVHAEIEQLHAEIGRVRADTEQIRADTGQVHAENEQIRAELRAHEQQSERRRVQLESAIAERREAEERFSAQLRDLRDEISELTVALDSVREAQANRPGLGRAWRGIEAALRSASQIASWIFRKPSRARLRYVPTYFALKRSGAFDPSFYSSQASDVAGSGQNLLMHYIEHGASEGRDPNPHFKTLEHVSRHPELLESGLNPLLHQIKYVGPIGLPAPSASGGLESSPRVVRRAEPGARARRQEAKERLELAVSTVPEGSTVLFAEYDETDLLKSSRIRSRLFQRPAADQSALTGSTSAMARLEALRAVGAGFLVLPPDASVWLSRDARFGRYLDRHYRVVESADAGVVFDLRRQADGPAPWPGQFEGFIQEHQARFETEPDVLDCGAGVRLDERFSELTVIQPPWLAADRLPYLSDSIDLVLTDARSEGGGGDEARRVARNGLVSARQDDGSMDLSIEWLRGADFRQPSVSIVIPTCDGADLLEPCLSGLVDTVPRHLQAEFIVVDDASTDETSSVVARWSSADDRVRLVRNAENLGFVDSCNRGAAEADGEALVFLNNDTLPIHGWLQPLIRTLFQDEGIGAVGGMLVYPNGTLQEAGAVVFSDGTGANFGKHDPEPDRPRYRFLRDVDYCSAALLTTRRATFERLAGFDTLFRPGYYEETDYCFRLREAGLRTVYQPESIIVHVEGATSGTDAFPREPKGHQAPNRVKFCERWSDALRSHPSRPTRFDEATWNQLGRHRPTMAKRSTS